ncbi:MAG TPA: hypothetical protein VIH57_22130 [Bacteroidales bacterium]
MKKTIFSLSLLILNISISCFGQFRDHKCLSDSLLSFKVGIYRNIEEFLNNKPSIPYMAERLNYNKNYTGDRDRYYISYYDIIGKKITLSMYEIWGFFDGTSFFISYSGKPFELIDFGPISYFIFHPPYSPSLKIEAVTNSGGEFQSPSTVLPETLFYDFENKTPFTTSKRTIEAKISKDKELYNEYKTNKQMKKRDLYWFYMGKYNIKHSFIITSYGIKIP